MAADSKLHEGVRYGDSNLVESSLEDGLDPNAIGLYGWSPMHEAASNGDLEILELLLQYNGDPNCCDDIEGCTPLHYAAREGHVECLRALLKAGGRYDVENNSGKSVLEEAAEECRHILDKEKTKDYLSMTLDMARITISKQKVPSHGSSAKPEGRRSSAETLGDNDSPREVAGGITPRAWNTIKVLESPKDAGKESITGTLQLSFEYNSKAKTFKIRVWSLQDILLPPAEFSNLSRLYIRSHLLPDKKGETKRKTDEIKIEDPTKLDSNLVTLRRKGMRDSFKAVFLPSTFKFSKGLEYQNVTQDMVRSKMVHIAVCVKQRYSTKTIPVANVQLEMKVAVRKLLKEKHPLHSCINYSMPDNIHAYDPHDIVIISEGMYSNRTTSHPTLRTKSRVSLELEETNPRASSDINLKAVRSHSVESMPSTMVDIQTGQRETSLDDLLEVSVHSDSNRSDQKVTVVDVHEIPRPSQSPLPGITEDGELTDVSIVSSSCHSPDSAVVDMDGLETINLDRDAISPVGSSTPSAKKLRAGVKHGFANPHITIVDDADSDDFEVSVDKLDGRKGLRDEVIDLSSSSQDLVEKGKKKGFRGQLHVFKKKSKQKKGKGDGVDNPGYVVDMRTGHRSLIGDFAGSRGKKGQQDLEMLEILSDEEADAVFADKRNDTTIDSRAKNKSVSSHNDSQIETVITVAAADQVTELKRGKKMYDVQGAMKHDQLALKPRRTLRDAVGKKEGDQRASSSKVSTSEIPLREVTSPVPIIVVECVDETDRSASAGSRSPRSPRHARKVSPIPEVSKRGRESTKQDFTPPITAGMPHTELSKPESRVSIKTNDTTHSPNGASHKGSPTDADVKYISELGDSDHTPKQNNRSRSGKEKVVRSKGRSPGKAQKTSAAAEPEFEMLTLWNDEEWRKKLATPEFKLRMFQRTSQDQHPSTPLLNKYHGIDPSSAAASNMVFVHETPPSKTSQSTPQEGVGNARENKRLHSKGAVMDKSKSQKRVEVKNNPSITKLSQSWL
ncbi:uncharacterized protein [Diadema antillarum]|uniref:uncharacterized protein n=1 Tax=Diadema antillarum TaxID=105358 RepID=UPI003A89AF86